MPRLSTLPLVAIVALVALGCGTRGDADPMASSRTELPFGLRPDLLPTGPVESVMTMIDGENQTQLGTVRTEVLRTGSGNDESFQFVLVQDVRMGRMTDTLTVDARTMRPVRYRNLVPGMQRIETDYGADGHVVSTVVRGDVETGVDTVLTGVHLDAASFTMLMPALPFTEDYSTTIPTLHYEQGAVPTEVRVLGSETVDADGSPREAWLVEHRLLGITSVHAVDKETREVLRVTADIGAGREFVQTIRTGA